ncbi:hypothetical protein KP509_14G077000 [Ceratopteris richardii]|uniref:RING-type E3 ubiquitin transferase n=1 Tax=Ceratopteris richardii TaxID=49495 RepID=A0A8T2TDD8_CERRI|nr:hypothetical protein KP509_14G077000 [Ceratopteris richardii]
MSRTDQQRTISTSDGAMDSSPLLNSTEEPSAGTAPSASRVSSRRGRLSRIFQIIIGGGTRRVMREPSVLVREAAAEQLEERQTDWSYSRPIVVLDFLWNVAFITVTVVVLILSRAEKPINPLRLWIGVYAAQCCIHMVCVWVEYCQRRQRYRRQRGTGSSLRETSISTSDGSHSDQGLDQIFEQISSSDLRC